MSGETARNRDLCRPGSATDCAGDRQRSLLRTPCDHRRSRDRCVRRWRHPGGSPVLGSTRV